MTPRSLLCFALVALVSLLVSPQQFASAATASSATDSAAVATSASASATASTSDLYTLNGAVKLPPGTPLSTTSFVGARVLLTSAAVQHTAIVRGDGSFSVPRLGGRSYIVDVHMADWTFPQVRLELTRKNGKVTAKASLVNSARTKLSTSPQLLLRPSMPAQYFQQRESVNIWAYLKSPMVIMMLITLVMVVVMPRMMSSMDPAELQEMQVSANEERRERARWSEQIKTPFSTQASSLVDMPGACAVLRLSAASTSPQINADCDCVVLCAAAVCQTSAHAIVILYCWSAEEAGVESAGTESATVKS